MLDMTSKTSHTYTLPPKRRVLAEEYRRQEEEDLKLKDVVGGLCRLGGDDMNSDYSQDNGDGKGGMEEEKKMRREIANSNERRRMQSINAGFQSLKSLLPHHDGEKLSKAAILQQTTEYIFSLEQEKTRLLTQNCQLKRMLNSINASEDSDSCSGKDSPPPVKRKKREARKLSSDEGVGGLSPCQDEQSIEEMRHEMLDLRCQLERERRLRIELEDQTRPLQDGVYPMPPGGIDSSLREITTRVPQLYPTTTIPDEEVCLDKYGKTRYPEKYPVLQRCLQDQNSHLEVSPPSGVSPLTPPMVTSKSTTGADPSFYSMNTSRQNLETIVQAIRHLEGDSLFTDDGSKHEKNKSVEVKCEDGRVTTLTNLSPLQYNRPGVIVQT